MTRHDHSMLTQHEAHQISELEARAQVESLDLLQHERRELMEQLAPLEAIYGANGMWEERRRALRGAIATELRTANPKLTVGAVEDLANADPRYQHFLDTGLDERIAFIRLRLRRDEITERIRNREVCLNAYNAETRLR